MKMKMKMKIKMKMKMKKIVSECRHMGMQLLRATHGGEFAIKQIHITSHMLACLGIETWRGEP
jgi:hypothetical protein